MTLGTDLAVVPGFAAHDAQALDLTTITRPRTPLLTKLLEQAQAAPSNPPADLATVSDRDNLAQALVLRLLTPRGSLTALGHPDYGSRLGELIGQRKNDATRALCRAYVLECVAQEPRVENTVTELAFDPQREQPDSLVLTLGVRPVAGGDPVVLGLELGL